MPAPYKLTWHENTHLCLCRQGAGNIHYFFCDFRYSNCPFFLWGGNKDYTPVSYMNSWRICFILLKSNITKVKSVDALNPKQYSWKKSSVRKEKKDNQYAIVMWSRFSLSELWNWKLLLKKKKKKSRCWCYGRDFMSIFILIAVFPPLPEYISFSAGLPRPSL